MRLLFIHQNLPGQFRHLIQHYTARPGFEVVGVGEHHRVSDNRHSYPPNLKIATYSMPEQLAAAGHPFLQSTAEAVTRGQCVARTLALLRQKGFIPDVIVAHPGWGEAMFVKDVYPESKLLCYGEFFYSATGRDFNFDPEFPEAPEEDWRLRVRNMPQLVSFDAADAILSPSQWQRASLPAMAQDRAHVIHDGINTHKIHPDTNASIALARDELRLTKDDEVITFVNRNLEPYRGFHTFMRAVPELQARRPKARVILVGGDESSYGRPSNGVTYRQRMLNEVGPKLDMSRIHFVGKVPYHTYLSMLQVSTAHVYLTYPFVLSWSMLEAMAAGCAVIGSRTAPVTEVLRDRENGLLVDFFSAGEIVDAVCRVCDDTSRMAALRDTARADVQRDYDLHDVCLPRQLNLIEQLANGTR